GLTRERLARVGVTPWAPSELALVPAVIWWILWVPMMQLVQQQQQRQVAMDTYLLVYRATIWIEPALVVATILALRYLDRRLREAEAFAAARAATAGAAAPPPEAGP